MPGQALIDQDVKIIQTKGADTSWFEASDLERLRCLCHANSTADYRFCFFVTDAQITRANDQMITTCLGFEQHGFCYLSDLDSDLVSSSL